MISRALLMVLMGLTCLQDFTVANSAKGPEDCCFKFFRKPIPVRAILMYQNTSNDCPKAGVIFTTRNSSRVCVDPRDRWVQKAIDLIDKRIFESST